ncbi:Ribosomal protein S10 [Rhynchospora pubera]|uniref:Ribosomal protein S10 n=1 Tax=Rhynchospora pubera TaxID=906938 RepID=A0AAV8GRT4_9POAL|nr:Ribosomal protein S10 [Rhynchospora pubera]
MEFWHQAKPTLSYLAKQSCYKRSLLLSSFLFNPTSQISNPVPQFQVFLFVLLQSHLFWYMRFIETMSTKIGIIIRSFSDPFRMKYPFMGLTPETSRIKLPDSRVLYTVLRSPHIDKKSREQFEMRVKKQYMVMKVDARDVEKKFFWLKRQRILGAQFEVRLHTKTRLDRGMLQKLVSSPTSSA